MALCVQGPLLSMMGCALPSPAPSLHFEASLHDIDERLNLSKDIDAEQLLDLAHRWQHDRAQAADLAFFLAQPESTASSRLLADVRRFKRIEQRDGGSGATDSVALAAWLTELGHRVTVRSALGGGLQRRRSGSPADRPATAAAAAAAAEDAAAARRAAAPGGGGPAGGCFRNLRHVFLIVQPDGSGSDGSGAVSSSGPRGVAPGSFIVDASFREHFAIPQPTPAYARLLASLPDEFAGTPDRLTALLRCLCSEMAASFEARGLALPPWRSEAALASKWLPRRARDTAIGGGGNGSRSGSGSYRDGPSPEPWKTVGGWAAPQEGPCQAKCGSASGNMGGPQQQELFNRLTDAEVARMLLARTVGGRGKGLLSGKLTGSPDVGRCGSDSGSPAGSRLRHAAAAAASTVVQAAAVDACSALATAGSAVHRQEPICAGQPATWKVKLGGAVAAAPTATNGL